MSTIATICARGGSKGLPGKNIKNLQGKPLIVYTIEQALACQSIDKVYVSTDDEVIAEVAREAGAIVPFMRPAELATDEAGKIPVIQHLVDWVVDSGVDVSRIVDLQPTSPLRSVEDIEACIELLDDETDVVITGFKSSKNPYFNMVEEKEDGQIGLVKPLGGSVVRRQDAPVVYAMNGAVYVWHFATLEKGLWGGRVKLYEMAEARSVDVDTAVDFKVVEVLMNDWG